MTTKTWLDTFDVRDQKEIDLARLYAAQYDHGSPGHLHLKIIAKLATLLDQQHGIEVSYSIKRAMTELEPEPEPRP